MHRLLSIHLRASGVGPTPLLSRFGVRHVSSTALQPRFLAAGKNCARPLRFNQMLRCLSSSTDKNSQSAQADATTKLETAAASAASDEETSRQKLIETMKKLNTTEGMTDADYAELINRSGERAPVSAIMSSIGIVVFLACAGLCVVLGVWQMQRREWKQALIEERESTLEKDPVDLSILRTCPHKDWKGLAHRKVKARGRFDFSRQRAIGPRQLPPSLGDSGPGTQGYYLITPFILEQDGEIPAGTEILVNRGFYKFSEYKKDSVNLEPDEVVEIVGLLSNGEKRNKHLLNYMPEFEDNAWILVDLPLMMNHLGLRGSEFLMGSGKTSSSSSSSAAASSSSASSSLFSLFAKAFGSDSSPSTSVKPEEEEEELRPYYIMMTGGGAVILPTDGTRALFVRNSVKESIDFTTTPFIHFWYSVTWFSLALALAGITFKRFNTLRRLKKR